MRPASKRVDINVGGPRSPAVLTPRDTTGDEPPRRAWAGWQPNPDKLLLYTRNLPFWTLNSLKTTMESDRPTMRFTSASLFVHPVAGESWPEIRARLGHLPLESLCTDQFKFPGDCECADHCPRCTVTFELDVENRHPTRTLAVTHLDLVRVSPDLALGRVPPRPSVAESTDPERFWYVLRNRAAKFVAHRSSRGMPLPQDFTRWAKGLEQAEQSGAPEASEDFKRSEVAKGSEVAKEAKTAKRAEAAASGAVATLAHGASAALGPDSKDSLLASGSKPSGTSGSIQKTQIPDHWRADGVTPVRGLGPVILAYLPPGRRLHCRVYATKGLGHSDPRFAPVVAVGLRDLQELRVNRVAEARLTWEERATVVAGCYRNVFEYVLPGKRQRPDARTIEPDMLAETLQGVQVTHVKSAGPHGAIRVARPLACTLCGECNRAYLVHTKRHEGALRSKDQASQDTKGPSGRRTAGQPETKAGAVGQTSTDAARPVHTAPLSTGNSSVVGAPGDTLHTPRPHALSSRKAAASSLVQGPSVSTVVSSASSGSSPSIVPAGSLVFPSFSSSASLSSSSSSSYASSSSSSSSYASSSSSSSSSYSSYSHSSSPVPSASSASFSALAREVRGADLREQRADDLGLDLVRMRAVEDHMALSIETNGSLTPLAAVSLAALDLVEFLDGLLSAAAQMPGAHELFHGTSA